MQSPIQVSPSTSFQPRKEFDKVDKTEHAFGLLSFNGSEILRLANFPSNVTEAVRRVLRDDVRHFREDPILAVSEFILAGKPFSGRTLRCACLTRLQLYKPCFTYLCVASTMQPGADSLGYLFCNLITTIYTRFIT